MQTHKLRPWTELVHLHPDVESGNTALAVYAIDLGALAAGDPNIPVCYRDAESFFRITYLTSGLRRLLEDVLGRLAGQDGDRVLQLRSPFGGGKSHTLAALYHAAGNRAALSQMPEVGHLPNPGSVRVAVFDGEKFDALTGKEVNGQRVRTVWGWLAWQWGEDALALVREHDERRVAPGGDVIAALLGDQPTLLLLDEVLKYLERAAGERIADSTLERQTKDFLHSLSVEVARSPRAVMVYSLQASAREAMGNLGLLQEMDHLTSRVDAKREPVTGDEILAVLHRRLLAVPPEEAAASAVAHALAEVVTHTRVAHADSEPTRRLAEEEGVRLRQRLAAAYPFHPALVDVMRERWASIPDFQRTRGALRFLAVSLHALKARGGAQTVLGPGDVPLHEPDVRYAFFTEVGQREAFQPVLEADLIGPNARVRHIDDRLAKENPALANVRPALRLATAILMYSFGGLPKEGNGPGEILPPGVTEAELLAACVGPDLDSITAQACLKELRDVRGCLYLHFDGARYCFKTTPNVNLLIEQEADAIRPEEVRARLQERLERRLAGQRSAFVWPVRSENIPGEEPSFLVACLPLEFAEMSAAEQERQANELFEKCGHRPRRYRNGLGLAVPTRAQAEPLRRAVRYLLAIERVEAKKKQLGVTPEQAGQLKERRQTEEAAEESAFRQLYSTIWLPKAMEGGLGVEKVEIGGRPLQATGIHERVMELLTQVSPPRVFGTLEPRRIVERLRLGEAPEPGRPARLGIKAREVQDAFFGILGFPRLTDELVLRRAIARGIEQGLFGYVSRGRVREEQGIYFVSREHVTVQRSVAADEIDLSDGFLLMPEAIPPLPEEVPPPVLDPLPTHTDALSIRVSGTSVAGTLIAVAGGAKSVQSQLASDETRFEVEVALVGNAVNLLQITAADAKGKVSAPVTVSVAQGRVVPPPPPPPPPPPLPPGVVQIRFRANRQQLYAAWNALANLADQAGTVLMDVKAERKEGFDSQWLRNAVMEPLDEAGLLGEESEAAEDG